MYCCLVGTGQTDDIALFSFLINDHEYLTTLSSWLVQYQNILYSKQPSEYQQSSVQAIELCAVGCARGQDYGTILENRLDINEYDQ